MEGSEGGGKGEGVKINGRFVLRSEGRIQQSPSRDGDYTAEQASRA